jgi:O-antigen/teichoic acid export membrane protein
MGLNGGIRSRVLRSFGADSLGQILNICIRLVLAPLFLSAWGGEAYGEWLILTAIAGWAYLSDLGGQLYFVNRLTEEWAKENIKEFQDILSTGLVLFLASSIFTFGCISLIIYWVPVASIFKLNAVNEDLARGILVLMIARFLVAFPVGLFLGIYRAIGLQARSVMYGNSMLLIQFIASIAVLLADLDMLVLASLEIIPFLVVFIFVVFDLPKRLPPSIRLFAIRNARLDILKRSISPSLHFLGLQLSQALIIQGSVLVIASLLGPVQVAIFSSMRIVANVISRFMGVLSHSVWPEITRLASLGEEKGLLIVFQVVQYLGVLSGLLYICLIAKFGNSLYDLWLHKSLPYDFWAMYILGGQVVINAIWTWGGNLLMATNRHEEYSRWQFPVNIFALLMCSIGAKNFGLVGAVVGLLVGQTLPMLAIVYFLVNSKGWFKVAIDIKKSSIVCILCLPLMLNIWSGTITLLALSLAFNFKKILQRQIG